MIGFHSHPSGAPDNHSLIPRVVGGGNEATDNHSCGAPHQLGKYYPLIDNMKSLWQMGTETIFEACVIVQK